MSETSFDLIIVGGGPGGYVAAIRAGDLGAKVALVEEREVGGTCLNRGCIPSKALIKCAEVLEEAKGGKTFGILTEGVSVDFDGVRKHKDRTVKQLVAGVEGLLKSRQVQVFNGRGKLLSPAEVAVSAGAETQRISAPHLIWATGSVPFVLPIPGADGPGVVTSDDAVDLPGPPESMAIIGGGAIGCEFAYVYSRFGTKVTIVEMMPNILPTEDPEASAVLAGSLKKGGVKIATGAKAQAIEEREGKKVLVFEQDGEEKTVAADMVLMAAGRRANTADMGLEEAGLALDRGRLTADTKLRTNIESILAIGDVTRGIGLAHWASHEGIAAAEMLFGGLAEPHQTYVPGVVFTKPEIGSVGQREHECRACNQNIVVGKFPFQALGKAAAIREREGFVKIVADATDGRVLGGTIVGPAATDLIAEIGLAVQMGLTVADIAQTMHSHPTLTEAIGEAAMDALGQGIHQAPKG
ncbi:MAG: dihydrolipoyl dehydrogenase [Armatimonadetes bacterium]|nr:dihydrolipoyl dehydrogenase [Armatimonadota bacterium]